MREIGLLAHKKDASEQPTNACILLFGRNPERFFPHSVISATISGKRRIVFEGNLISQYRALLEWLESKHVNPIIKVKGKQKHYTRAAYPERAPIKMLVNMIVHRNYEMVAPSQMQAAFLSRLSKGQIAEVLQEAGCTPHAVRAVEKAPKAEAVAEAEKLLQGTGWLPTLLQGAATA